MRRGTLPFKRTYRGVGFIRRLSGTSDRRVLAAIITVMDALHREGRFDVLRAVKEGTVRPIDVLRYGPDQAPEAPVKPPQHVYAVRALPSGNIKIGITNDVAYRIQQMRTNTWEELVLLFSYPGCTEEEQRLHRKFREHWIAREWFRPGPEVLLWIAEETGEVERDPD